MRAVAGDRTSLDLTLQAAIEGEVTVTGETPMVDKFNVSAGATVSGEIGEQIGGVTRTYYGIINALPGVTADAENDDIQQTRPSVNGAHFADQGVFIDGVDTTFAKFGGSRVRVPTTALTEVSIEAGGSSAEYGRYVGSATNVIVKAGTNRFHAETLWNHQRIDWGADYKDQPSLTERTNKPYPADWFRRLPWRRAGPGPRSDPRRHGRLPRARALPARRLGMGRRQRTASRSPSAARSPATSSGSTPPTASSTTRTRSGWSAATRTTSACSTIRAS